MKIKLLALILFFSGATRAQKLNISWKRMGDLAFYSDENDFNFYSGENDLYDQSLWDVFNIYIEKPLKSDYFTIGLDLSYGNYHQVLSDKYDYLGDSKQFYDRSVAIGLSGRAYTKPFVIRGFAEATVYGNFIRVHQPVVIKHSFGSYDRIIHNDQLAASGSLALGISLGGDRFRYEPYFQFGWISELGEKRAGTVMVSSIGVVKNSDRESFFFTPFAVKVLF